MGRTRKDHRGYKKKGGWRKPKKARREVPPPESRDWSQEEWDRYVNRLLRRESRKPEPPISKWVACICTACGATSYHLRWRISNSARKPCFQCGGNVVEKRSHLPAGVLE